MYIVASYVESKRSHPDPALKVLLKAVLQTVYTDSLATVNQLAKFNVLRLL